MSATKKECGKLCCTKITDLTVKKKDCTILHNINLHVHCGELTALIGPNGAGKSTLIRSIIGEVSFNGKLEFLGENGTEKPIIGYVPQNISFEADSPVTVYDLFLSSTTAVPCCFIKSKDNRNKIIQALIKVNAHDVIDRRLSQLSGGELQRVFLGLALMPLPNLLLLDEPVSGVDQNGIELFWKILSDIRKSYDLSIIIISHNFSQVASYADRVVLIDKEILQNGSADLVFASNQFKNLFGVSGVL